jgi:acetyl-CoA carboxylase biotin carboxyl carrier protein
MTDTPTPVHRPPEAELDALTGSVLKLLHASSEPPARLRVTLDGATVEMEWRAPKGARMPGAAIVARQTAELTGGADPDADTDRFYVCAPMVGTFYHASEPGAEPYVKIDDVVNPGQQVGVVEAMKLFNAIDADRPGRVVEILVPNATAVEYGQRLIACAPADSP